MALGQMCERYKSYISLRDFIPVGKRDWIQGLCHGLVEEVRPTSGLKDTQEGLTQAVSMNMERIGELEGHCIKHNEVTGSDTPGFKFRLFHLIIIMVLVNLNSKLYFSDLRQ